MIPSRRGPPIICALNSAVPSGLAVFERIPPNVETPLKRWAIVGHPSGMRNNLRMISRGFQRRPTPTPPLRHRNACRASLRDEAISG